MKARSLRLRFYLEVALGVVGTVLFVIAFFASDSLEIALGIDFEESFGALESLVPVIPLAIAGVSLWLAAAEWRRPAQPEPAPA